MKAARKFSDAVFAAAEFLSAFPETVRDYCTGGNCSAWCLQFDNGFTVLLTDGDGEAEQPQADTRKVFISIEDADGPVEFEDDTGPVSWELAAELVRATMRGDFK